MCAFSKFEVLWRKMLQRCKEELKKKKKNQTAFVKPSVPRQGVVWHWAAILCLV